MARDLRSLLAGTDIPEDKQAELRALMQGDFWDDPRNSWAVHTTLAGVDWQWPWHSEWAARFDALGALPYMWRNDDRHAGKARRELGGYDHRIKLLCHTASFLHYRDARRVQARALESGWCRFLPPRDEPAAVERIIDDYIIAYAVGDGPVELPPLFPGDRTLVGFFPDDWLPESLARHGPCFRLRPTP